MPTLEAISLSHQFTDGVWGLRDVSLTLRSHEFTLIAGPNGAGKTLLARHLTGLVSPTAGRVLLDGEDISQDPLGTHRRVGLVFQQAEHQIVGQTVAEDVDFGPRNLSLPVEEVEWRRHETLQRLDLHRLAERDPRTLSGGEMRRLAIAGMVALGCELLIVDEPFSNLDRSATRVVVSCLRRLAKEGCGIVVITHAIGAIIKCADRMIMLTEGRVREDGPPDELASHLDAYDL